MFSPDEGEQYPGGEQTAFIHSENAFGQPAPGLTGIDANFFYTGNSLFNQNWVAAPSSTTARDGLGPTINATSCSACHFKDGRGRPPLYYDEIATGFLLRLSIVGEDNYGGPMPDPNYGGQLNDGAIFGISREGQVMISYIEIAGTFPDGEAYSLRQPSYTFSELNFGPLSNDIMISPRVGNQMIGLGLLEAISLSDILMNADENDLDGDGISGRPNYVWNKETSTSELGRFGWKANQPTIKQQVAGAFHGDMGITTSLFPNNECPGNQLDCMNCVNGGEPELEDENLDKVVLYSANLAAPSRPDYNKQDVLHGKRLFYDLNCIACHKPSYTTGVHNDFNHLSHQKIWPYTDLLLHDMGSNLSDGRPDYLATGNEWRTPPLWGIGLFETVNGHTYYLHDGRARNLNEAIIWHGGEAEKSKTDYMNLSSSERELVIKFLKSL
ncbi:MAG: c-type cytochrome [Flavobacteriales bacterium]|nr:c-type cytochrome [Flavobacteriales bacterium]